MHSENAEKLLAENRSGKKLMDRFLRKGWAMPNKCGKVHWFGDSIKTWNRFPNFTSARVHFYCSYIGLWIKKTANKNAVYCVKAFRRNYPNFESNVLNALEWNWPWMWCHLFLRVPDGKIWWVGASSLSDSESSEWNSRYCPPVGVLNITRRDSLKNFS